MVRGLIDTPARMSSTSRVRRPSGGRQLAPSHRIQRQPRRKHAARRPVRRMRRRRSGSARSSSAHYRTTVPLCTSLACGACCQYHLVCPEVHSIYYRDTVSSVGITRGPSLPETTNGMRHVCVFRHALASDERRIKFLPEYANGGAGPDTNSDSKTDIKEVWFAGSHSDM